MSEITLVEQLANLRRHAQQQDDEPDEIRKRLVELIGITAKLADRLDTLTGALIRDDDRINALANNALVQINSNSPRFHMRIQITKNTKGYSYETSVTAEDDDEETVVANTRQLLIDADTIARDEIARRELLDVEDAS